MDTKHITTGAQLKTAGSEEGALTAVFSTFDQIDRDGDVVLASAIPDGQEVPLVWAHDWNRPIGKGTIHVEGGRAVFKGAFWLDTDDGLQAYRKVKNAGTLQEYSWGFGILKANTEKFRGLLARVIKATEIFEVSPVLVGAGGRGMTGTLSVKHRQRHGGYVSQEEALRVVAESELIIARQLGVKVAPTGDELKRAALAAVVESELIFARHNGVRV